jgi:hypothetical protein
MKLGWLVMLLALHAFAGAVFAQADILVTNAPFAPGDATAKAGTAFAREVACFRCAVTNSAADVTGMQLTPSGTGDWLNDLDPSIGVEVWLDDGDAVFSAATDARLGFAGGSTTAILVSFAPSANIAAGSSADFWIVLNVVASAGTSIPESYILSLASSSDLSTSGASNVTLGSPQPVGSNFSVVVFFVSTVSPASTSTTFPIAFIGSGFALPVTVTIGGVPCTGTPSISPMGTTLSGLVVPSPITPGDLGPHPIVITSGLLPPQTLSQTFKYSADGRRPGSDDGCSTGEAHALSLLAVVAGVLSLLGLSRVIRTRT